MDKIHIQPISGLSAAELDVEIVERKGLGHPDTICDAVMERVSQALSKTYVERFGTILHHNCDKGLLVAGQVERHFGEGRVLEPMRLVIGDRATAVVGNEELNVADIAVEAAKAWFRENLRRVDPDRHLSYQVELKPGSEELTRLFVERKGVLGANDTSAAVGYAPLSETERLVLQTERYLNSPEFKARFPETGEDVKVMGVRTAQVLEVTIAMPFLVEYVERESDYFQRKEAVQETLLAHLRGQRENLHEISVSLNTLDRPGTGMAGMYLSVLGTSAEDADSGEVGRGNQVNGLIALNRPRASEAAAGKNPVSHVGKIYNVLTHVLATRIHSEIPGLREVVVWLCSRIGEPVDRPQIASVQIRLQPGFTLANVADPICKLVKEELERMPLFCEELAQGRYPIC
ncbi:MAG: methionine adenosyltransferase [Candidatus Methylomirabilales bacterium]